MNKKSKVTLEVLLNKYPYVYQVRFNDKYYRSIYVIGSPLSNCQTFSIGSANNFSQLDKEQVSDVLKLIYGKVKKKQFIIDIKDTHKDSILKSIKPFLSSIKKKSYISTNQSKMILCICVLDLAKLSIRR